MKSPSIVLDNKSSTSMKNYVTSGLFTAAAVIRTMPPYSDPSRSDSAQPAKYLRFDLNGLVKLHVYLGIIIEMGIKCAY